MPQIDAVTDTQVEETIVNENRSHPVNFFRVVDLNTNKSIKKTIVGPPLELGKLEKRSKFYETSSSSDVSESSFS